MRLSAHRLLVGVGVCHSRPFVIFYNHFGKYLSLLCLPLFFFCNYTELHDFILFL